ncbi:hypothetical protein NPIL_260831, partial [Nephila pilipes]
PFNISPMQIIDDSDAVRVWAAELIRGRISFGVNDGPVSPETATTDDYKAQVH